MTTEHVDVLIVGAGLSGVAAACHLQARCPGKTYAILEARAEIGGTWDLFRYPGVRSDSDMYTLGFSFRPWTAGESFADGPSIRRYVRETARERGVEEQIRFGHRVVGAAWSTPGARWRVAVERTDTGDRVELTCGFLFSCTGYYRYDEGYTPELPGVERFRGQVVHPQEWTEDVDHAGRRVVVIGSGATAITLVPALTDVAAHVTMLQRSPSYVLSLPGQDAIAAGARRRLGPDRAHTVIRWKNVLVARTLYRLSRRFPQRMRALIRWSARRRLPPGYDVDTHFNPRYDPWDQRMCFVPDGDFFAAIRHGRASVVTDRIETFTEDGILLASGRRLEADLVVTATGLNLLALGAIRVTVDGREIDLAETLTYKGCMLGGVPNLAIAMGYTNASWTLKCELISEYVCRLLDHMDTHGYRQATPTPGAAAAERRPLLDLSSGYVQRSVAQFPKQGAADPWRTHQDYLRDIRLFRHGPVDDGMAFARAPAAVAA